jgi:hypothetical protein
MDVLPDLSASLLVRTWFGDDDAWARTADAAVAGYPAGAIPPFRAEVELVDDRRWAGASAERLRAAAQPPTTISVLFAADERAIAEDEHPVLVIDIVGEETPFRCVAEYLWAVESNLNIGHTGWDDFVRGAGPDGVFRWFPGAPPPDPRTRRTPPESEEERLDRERREANLRSLGG